MIELKISIIKQLLVAMTTLLSLLQSPGEVKLGAVLQYDPLVSIDQQIIGKTPAQKSEIKSGAIIDSLSKGILTSYGYDIEIMEFSKIDGGVEILARAWKNGNPVGFVDGTVEIERFRVYNPPLLVSDSLGTIERTSIVNGQAQITRYRQDPLGAIKQVLGHTIKITAKDGNKIIKGKIGHTTSTFYPDAGDGNTTIDGIVYISGGTNTWAAIHNGNGGAAETTGGTQQASDIVGNPTENRWTELVRSIYTFDTSAIDTGDTISSATASFIGDTNTVDNFSQTVNLVGSAPAANNTLAASDYQGMGISSTTLYSDTTPDLSATGWDTGAYVDLALNSTGISNIDKDGITKFGIRLSGDRTNTEPTWANLTAAAYTKFADTVGTTSDPKLVVVHAVAVAAGVLRRGVNTIFIP